MLIWLKQLRVLDGTEVRDADRESAQDAYLNQVMAFNQKVEEVQREHEREMAAVQSRRKRIVAHADVLQQEMLAAFEGLESLIQSGRAQITSEHSRQLKVSVKFWGIEIARAKPTIYLTVVTSVEAFFSIKPGDDRIKRLLSRESIIQSLFIRI